MTIPAGTLLATDYLLLAPGDPVGSRFVFETFRALTVSKPALGSGEGTVAARAILEVADEPLGVSDGTPHQQYLLRPPRQALGITDPDAPAPVLTDFVHRESGYEPNPQVTVAAVPWTVIDKYWQAPLNAPPWFPGRGEMFLDAIAVSPEMSAEAERQIVEVLRVRRHLPAHQNNDFAIFTDDAFMSLYVSMGVTGPQFLPSGGKPVA